MMSKQLIFILSMLILSMMFKFQNVSCLYDDGLPCHFPQGYLCSLDQPIGQEALKGSTKLQLSLSLAESESGFCWTKWINRSTDNEGVDLETFSAFAAVENQICSRPFAVDYARVDGEPVIAKVECDFYGCVCRDIDQKPGVVCSDYKVRFLCPCDQTDRELEKLKDFFICNKAETKTISCPGQSLIKITSAYYGNVWLSPCGLGSRLSSCRKESSGTLETISLLCDHKQTCTVAMAAFNDVHCNGVNMRLHVQFSCEDIARAPGNYIGRPGEFYIDPSCKYKCLFLMSNRVLCTPICAVHYGSPCPPGSIVRWTTKPDTNVKQCNCRVPFCVEPGNSCTVNSKVYRKGEIFELGCQEECICLGHNDLKCSPLCPNGSKLCPKDHVKSSIIEETRYPQCKCQVSKCLKV